jgi:acyl carrier protein
VIERVQAFLQSRLRAKSDTGPLGSLFLSGRLDSLDAMETVVFLEQEFGLDFAEIGFDLESIDSVEAICALIEEHP